MRHILFIVFIFILSCHTSQSLDIKKEIINLKTQKDKERYITTLFDIDQNVRNSIDEYEIKKRNNFDVTSEEYLNYIKKQIETDSINFEKLVTFINYHGYPSFKNKNWKADAAITAIMMHQDYRNQIQFYPHLYTAYKEGKLSPKDFSSILNRMYNYIYGKRYTINGNTSIDENITILIEKLNLKN